MGNGGFAPLVLDAAMLAVAVLPAAQTHVVRRVSPFLGACVGAGQLAEPVVYRIRRETDWCGPSSASISDLGLVLVLTRRRA